MKRKRVWWTIGGVAAIVAIGGAVAAFRGGQKQTAVAMAVVGREDLQAKVTANGKVQAQKKVDISATIAGQITQLAVEEGDLVKKGQFLLQIDPVNPRALAKSTEFSTQALRKELDSARFNFEQARADAERAEANHAAGIVPLAELQRARTYKATAEAALHAAEERVEQALATLEGARDTLAKTTVRSPIDGVVTARRVEEGEVAVIGVQNSPGTVLLTISDMSVVESEMEVDETSIPSVAVAQEAVIRVDAYPNKTFEGVVTEVGSSPILQSGALTEAIKFKVKIKIQNPPPGIKPGLSVQADIMTGFRPQALTVPIQALVMREKERKPGQAPRRGEPRDEEGVWIVNAGKVRFQPITTGLLGELSIEVLSGLKGGETIVTGPFRALRELKPDDAVRAEKPEEDATTASR
ncbi:MAG: efflux RND transporter periplasmic adaptor subunit [Acidobacteriota bacterium]